MENQKNQRRFCWPRWCTAAVQTNVEYITEQMQSKKDDDAEDIFHKCLHSDFNGNTESVGTVEDGVRDHTFLAGGAHCWYANISLVIGNPLSAKQRWIIQA